jgi:hypothetical protein
MRKIKQVTVESTAFGLIDFFGVLTPLSAIFQLYHGDQI